MISCATLISSLESGAQDRVLSQFYAPDGSLSALSRAKERNLAAAKRFLAEFAPAADSAAAMFSSPGRTEIGGNHTDHQHGRVLCGSVDLDIIACAAPNGLGGIRICSEGYPGMSVDLGDLSPRTDEKNTSSALVRGVAAEISRRGHPVRGLDIYMSSQVLTGSGLSSSAAFGVLIGNVINHFFCGSALPPVELAKIAQYAETVYFGKPCGLMDQCGSSLGGAVFLDFKNPGDPAIEKIDFDFSSTGHSLCIVDTGSCHADLTDDYADITREMGAVAAHFGEKWLRDVPEASFRAAIPEIRKSAGDRAILRALHFYKEDLRAEAEAEALKRGDFEEFLRLVRESGLSSLLLLQNTWSVSDPRQQAIPLALALGEEVLGGSGAIRVHGGGFAGTVQAFVPEALLPEFSRSMEGIFGKGACHILRIRPQGSCVLIS